MSEWQTDSHQSRDWSVVIFADGMSHGQKWTFWTSDIVQCFTTVLHCWSICFRTLYDFSFKCLEMIMMMFKLTWRNWCQLWHVYACCISQGIIKTLFKRDWWFWYRFVPNLLEYICAKNYQNIISWSDKVIAKIKRCSFFDSQCTIHY